jgi:CheY-like chemotaxis protein
MFSVRGTDPALLLPIRYNYRETMDENRSRLVLVVDDDEGVRKVLCRWLADMGYGVSAAADAESALDIMREHAIDVALIDVRMPGRDGIWLVDRVCRLYPTIAMALATGLLEMDPMVTLRPGVVGYIVKPFNRAALEDVVKRGFEERKRLLSERPDNSRLLTDGVIEGFVVAIDGPRSPAVTRRSRKEQGPSNGRPLLCTGLVWTYAPGAVPPPAPFLMPSVTIPTFSTPAPLAASMTLMMSP